MDDKILERLCEEYWNAGTTIKNTWTGEDEDQRRSVRNRMRQALERLETEGVAFVNTVEDSEV